MMAWRRGRIRSETGLTVGVVGLLLVAALVMLLGEHGAFSRFATGGNATAPLPGVTLDEDASAGDAPVVTSLRSNSEAQRRGVHVGDRIQAVDGHSVRDMAALRRAIAEHAGPVPVSLQFERDGAVWQVALDRIDQAAADVEPVGQRNDPEDPARRGR